MSSIKKTYFPYGERVNNNTLLLQQPEISIITMVVIARGAQMFQMNQ